MDKHRRLNDNKNKKIVGRPTKKIRHHCDRRPQKKTRQGGNQSPPYCPRTFFIIKRVPNRSQKLYEISTSQITHAVSWVRFNKTESNNFTNIQFVKFLPKCILGGGSRVHAIHKTVSINLRKTRRPINCCCSAKRDVSHPTATVVYNACYQFLQKRSCITVHRLAWAN